VILGLICLAGLEKTSLFEKVPKFHNVKHFKLQALQALFLTAA